MFDKIIQLNEGLIKHDLNGNRCNQQRNIIFNLQKIIDTGKSGEVNEEKSD